MRYTTPLLALALGLSSLHAHAQTAEDSVKAAVNQLFTAMKTSDGDLVRRSFTDSAILQSIGAKVSSEKIGDFAAIVAKQPAGDFDERIQFDIVRIDGPLAIVWAPYEFYYKGKYSHKGVDSFQLIRTDGAWKIQYLIDTRRK
jgi:hypothetical protein